MNRPKSYARLQKESEEGGEPLRELVEGVKGRLKKIVEDADREQVVNDMS